VTDQKTDAAAELVPLCVCGSTMEASVVRGALEAHDIFCYVQGENHRNMLGMLGPYIEVRVLVRRADRDDAAAVLAALRATDEVSEEELERLAEEAGAGDDAPDGDAPDTALPRAVARRHDD
jgi:hypothetical protein